MLIIKIHNDGSGNNDSANYDYTVFVNKKIIAEGRIERHNRNDGWKKLVARLAEERTTEIKDTPTKSCTFEEFDLFFKTFKDKE